jgi:hypothetical protein
MIFDGEQRSDTKLISIFHLVTSLNEKLLRNSISQEGIQEINPKHTKASKVSLDLNGDTTNFD